MSKKRINFTEFFISSLKPKDKEYFVWDSGVGGLGIRVTPSGSRSFVFKKARRKNIGSVDRVSLKDARSIASKYNAMISDGKEDEVFSKAPPIPSLHEVCKEYLEYRKKGTLQELPISKSTYSSWSTIINKHLKNSTFSKMMVDKVTISHAQNFFDSLHQTPAQANRAFTFLKLAFEYCSTRGYRPMNSNVWLYIKKYRENPKRTRINSSEEFGAFIRYLILAERGDIRDKRGDRISLSWVYLRWLELYTGARGDELRTLTIEEINFEERVITKERHKTARITGQDKEIVLNDEAIDVLRRAIDNIDRPYHNRYVLVGKGGNSHIARDSRRQWTNMVEYIRQDIPEFEATPYSLRREFIKRGKMANNNDSSMVQEIVGHKSIVTTELYATDKEVIKINRMKRSKDSQKISSLISREVDRIKGTL